MTSVFISSDHEQKDSPTKPVPPDQRQITNRYILIISTVCVKVQCPALTMLLATCASIFAMALCPPSRIKPHPCSSAIKPSRRRASSLPSTSPATPPAHPHPLSLPSFSHKAATTHLTTPQRYNRHSTRPETTAHCVPRLRTFLVLSRGEEVYTMTFCA